MGFFVGWRCDLGHRRDDVGVGWKIGPLRVRTVAPRTERV